MTKVLFILVALVCVTHVADALAAKGGGPATLNEQKGCYIKDLDAVIPFGQWAPAKSGCFKYICHDESVSMLTCPDIQALPPCRPVKPDFKKPYPGCCPTFKCP